MKKKLLTVLGIVSTLLIATVIALVIYFWSYIKLFDVSLLTYSNIKALYIELTMTEEEKAARSKAIDDNLSEEIKKYVSIEIRDFTEEEKRLVESGEKTKTEIVAQIITETTQPPANNNQESSTSEPTVTTTPAKETADEIVARHISKLYEYHGEFEVRVENLKSSAYNWMHTYKRANTNITWKEAKVATLDHFIDTATKIEADCYAKVDAQIVALEKDLKAIGADTSIVATVKNAAYNEMDIRKSKIVAEGNEKLNS